MITFLFKQKPLHLDCFTVNTLAYNFAPIDHASKFIPDWWKQLPKDYPASSGVGLFPTMKSCAGIIDLYKNGIIIPLWSDLSILIDKGQCKWQFADETSTIEPHGTKQMSTFIQNTDTFHIKLISPWRFTCKEDIPWHFSQPVWNDYASKDYCTPTGILDFKNQHAANINMLIRLPESPKKEINLAYRHPLAHMIPLSERPIKIHTHLVSLEEFIKIPSTNVSFRSGFYKTKNFTENKESKCPFGFKKS
jgi:hypothetical protein